MRNSTKILLIIILLIAAVLRIFHLAGFSFCIDEGMAFYTISQPTLAKMLDVIRVNKDLPPLHFILMRYWLKLGSSEFMLRLFSVIFGVLSICAIYKLAKTLFDEKVALLSAFLLAISPLHIYYSQMIKNYTLSVFLAFLTIYFFLKLLSENNLVSWLGYLIAIILSVYTHYFAFLLILSATIFLFFYYDQYKHLLKKWLLSLGIVFLSYLFWLPVLFSSLESTSSFDATKPMLLRLIELPKVFYTFSVGFSSFDTTSFVSVGRDIISHLWLVIPVVFIFSLLIGLALTNFKKSPKELALLLIFLFIPIVLMFVINFALNSRLFMPRYFLMFSGPYYILTAVGITKLKKNSYRILSILFIVLLCGYSLYNYYFLKQYQRSGQWREAAEHIRLFNKRNDLILMPLPQFVGDPFDYYKTGLEKITLYKLVNPLEANDNLFNEVMTEIIDGHKRVWFCRLSPELWDPDDRTMNWLKNRYPNYETFRFHKFDFILFGTKDK